MTRPEYDLRLGDYRDVLDGETWDALICDPPYGARTHAGNNQNALLDRFANRRNAPLTALPYAHWTPDDVTAFVTWAHPRTRSWMVCFTSHDLIPVWEAAYKSVGRYSFAPVPFLQHRARLAVDGPGSGSCYIMVARPREKRFLGWGSLPCWYGPHMAPPATLKDYHQGGKPLSIMAQVVADYSRPGDRVCDPCAGGGTTLLAAVKGFDTRTGRAVELRRALGAEFDPDTHAAATERLRAALALPLFDLPPAQVAMTLETR